MHHTHRAYLPSGALLMLCTVCVCGAQALTTWLVASDAEEDVSLSQGLDPATWERHFSDGGEAAPVGAAARVPAARTGPKKPGEERSVFQWQRVRELVSPRHARTSAAGRS